MAILLRIRLFNNIFEVNPVCAESKVLTKKGISKREILFTRAWCVIKVLLFFAGVLFGSCYEKLFMQRDTCDCDISSDDHVFYCRRLLPMRATLHVDTRCERFGFVANCITIAHVRDAILVLIKWKILSQKYLPSG